MCLSASLSSKVIASHVITESAISTNSHVSCYFISQKRALSEIFSYLQTYRIFKVPGALQSWGETKCKKIKFKNYLLPSFYLKLSVLGKTQIILNKMSWDLQKHISLVLPGKIQLWVPVFLFFPALPFTSVLLPTSLDLCCPQHPVLAWLGKSQVLSTLNYSHRPATAASKELLSDTFPCI